MGALVSRSTPPPPLSPFELVDRPHSRRNWNNRVMMCGRHGSLTLHVYEVVLYCFVSPEECVSRAHFHKFSASALLFLPAPSSLSPRSLDWSVSQRRRLMIVSVDVRTARDCWRQKEAERRRRRKVAGSRNSVSWEHLPPTHSRSIDFQSWTD